MNRHGSVRVPRLVRGTLAAGAITAIAIAGATPASASAPDSATTNDDRVSTTADRASLAADRAVQQALIRDLGISADEIDELVNALAGTAELADQLRSELGESYAGTWFDHQAGTLVVATTDPATTDTIQDAGAVAELVSHAEAELAEVQHQLDALLEADPAAMADAFSWRVDVQANQVVLIVDEAEVDSYQALATRHGDAIRVEGSQLRPEPADHDGSWLDGGTRFEIPAQGYWCSIGFNAYNPDTLDRYFITAGHCGDVNDQTSHFGTAVGPFVASTFPTHDEALVQITNSSWSTGPFVWTYPGVISVQGPADSPVGTPICASGITTEVTCGTITNKNVTVNYAQGAVFGMGQHNACTRPGDSGGATYSPGYYAEGIHSGSVSYNDACPSDAGLENQAFYQEITDTLSRYGPQYGIVLG